MGGPLEVGSSAVPIDRARRTLARSTLWILCDVSVRRVSVLGHEQHDGTFTICVASPGRFQLFSGSQPGMRECAP